MNLSPRLQCIADFVPVGSKVADIGTDHAYLIIHLVENEKIDFAIGGDLNQGPYLSALKSVKEVGLTNKISIRHGNGLAVLSPNEVDLITIAGMGGGTIIEILEAQPKVLANIKRLILQPMIGSEILRKWLINSGWAIVKEKLVEDDGRIYEIIVADSKHKVAEMEYIESKSLFQEEIDFLISPLLIINRDPLLGEHLTRLINSEEKILKQISKSNSPEAMEKQKEFEKRIEIMRVILCQLNSKQ